MNGLSFWLVRERISFLCIDLWTDIHDFSPQWRTLSVANSLRELWLCTDDMSKGSISTRSDDAGETTLGWATGQCVFPRRRHRIAVFDIFLSWLKKIRQRAARAVRDMVTCSTPQSNGFEKNLTSTSQENPVDLQDIQDETSSITSNLQILPDKPMDDGWSTSNKTNSSLQCKISYEQVCSFPFPFLYKIGCNIRRALMTHLSFCEHYLVVTRSLRSSRTRFIVKTSCIELNYFCYLLSNNLAWIAFQDADNSERNLWTHGQKVTPNSNCGPKLPSNFFELPTKQRLRAVKMVVLLLLLLLMLKLRRCINQLNIRC